MSKKPKRVESPYVSQTDHPRCVVQGERTGNEAGKCTVIAIRHRDGVDLYPHGAEGIAEDDLEARRIAVDWFGTAWCDLYDAEPDRVLFPLGELHRIEGEERP